MRLAEHLSVEDDDGVGAYDGLVGALGSDSRRLELGEICRRIFGSRALGSTSDTFTSKSVVMRAISSRLRGD